MSALLHYDTQIIQFSPLRSCPVHTGFHLSGIVWTYPPSGGGSSNAASSHGQSNSSNSTNNNNSNPFAVVGAAGAHIAQGPYNRLADGVNNVEAFVAANNANNNLIAPQQQPGAPAPALPQPHIVQAGQQQPVPIQQQMAGMRMPSTERDTTNNSFVNQPLNENKKYNVSVSFDR